MIEYATLGFLTALTGVLLAVAANAALATSVFDASPWPDTKLLLTVFGAVMGISVLGGLALSGGVTSPPPLEILRGGS